MEEAFRFLTRAEERDGAYVLNTLPQCRVPHKSREQEFNRCLGKGAA